MGQFQVAGSAQRWVRFKLPLTWVQAPGCTTARPGVRHSSWNRCRAVRLRLHHRTVWYMGENLSDYFAGEKKERDEGMACADKRRGVLT